MIFNVAYGLVFLNQNKLYKNNIWEYRFWIFMIAALHILPVFLHFLFQTQPEAFLSMYYKSIPRYMLHSRVS